MKIITSLLTAVCLTVGISLQPCHAMDPQALEKEQAVERMKLTFQAFKVIGLPPTHILIHDNEMDVFTSLPPNFLTFVKSKDEIPKNKTIEILGNNPPCYHCNFLNTFQWNETPGYMEEAICLGYTGFSVPNLSLSLFGYRKDQETQILVTPATAVFHIDINRRDEQNAFLKSGLEEFVTKKMKDGFYVVAPDSLQQIDWQKNDEILKNFQTQRNHRYMLTKD